MKPATVHQIKKELLQMESKQMMEFCLRLAKYKKENKELLTYLLFEARDEAEYVKGLKEEIAHQFAAMNIRNLYYAKKSLRKILKYMDRFIRYSGNKETEVDMRIFFCEIIKNSSLPIRRSQVLLNLYKRQLIKIEAAMGKLHEDLQFDFQERFHAIK